MDATIAEFPADDLMIHLAGTVTGSLASETDAGLRRVEYAIARAQAAGMAPDHPLLAAFLIARDKIRGADLLGAGVALMTVVVNHLDRAERLMDIAEAAGCDGSDAVLH